MQTNSSLPRHAVFRRLVLGVVAGGALFCALVVGDRPAAAQVVEVAPPAVRLEVVPVAPPPHFFWVGGYWGWYGGRHVWHGGYWERERPGWVYERPHWARMERRWRFAPGHWHRR